jgi:hypothetical protein
VIVVFLHISSVKYLELVKKREGIVTKTYKKGSNVFHPEHGKGIVIQEGDEYIGVRFEQGGEALLRLDKANLAETSEIINKEESDFS